MTLDVLTGFFTPCPDATAPGIGLDGEVLTVCVLVDDVDKKGLVVEELAIIGTGTCDVSYDDIGVVLPLEQLDIELEKPPF